MVLAVLSFLECPSVTLLAPAASPAPVLDVGGAPQTPAPAGSWASVLSVSASIRRAAQWALMLDLEGLEDEMRHHQQEQELYVDSLSHDALIAQS